MQRKNESGKIASGNGTQNKYQSSSASGYNVPTDGLVTKVGKRRVLKGTQPSLARNTVRSMTSAVGGFLHLGVLAKFNESRRNGDYSDDGFDTNKDVVQLELAMWKECRELFSLRNHIYVDKSIWGKRDKSKKQVAGVMKSAKAFSNRVSTVMSVLKADNEDVKIAIFLVNTGCSDTINSERLVHANALIVRCVDDKYSFFLSCQTKTLTNSSPLNSLWICVEKRKDPQTIW